MGRAIWRMRGSVYRRLIVRDGSGNAHQRRIYRRRIKGMKP